MSKFREHGEDARRARTEALLHQAADFTPIESVPEGLAVRAMARWETAGRDCSPRQRRNFVPAISLGLIAIALFCFLSRPGSNRLPALTAWTAQKTAPNLSHSKQIAASGTQQTHRQQTPQRRSPLPANKTMLLARHALRHPKMRPKAPPKAIWTVETIRTEQVGALYSVWTMLEEGTAQAPEGSEQVVLQPAVLRIPLGNRVTACQSPSGSPFPMPQALSFMSMPQEVGPQHLDAHIHHSTEEETQP